ncbi:hypothetical protein EIN_354590 [Entamoeba invadens IP1]|uniref:Uncharacterized protein n=1 Tax=Entamoeba invadens IP1 TaxID=370355 RepID=L7FLE5_ENTIV|nr:hypothetical protein EIN_354590 [Entamoeba invadens IP1]ELP87157.1 hypothetical protein EIN_354590 [Entamoeba invadens IP1]|eukprot:XP_004253928.1 hypothetical protein EIN_354590 [Entamoeba invadens IP1]
MIVLIHIITLFLCTVHSTETDELVDPLCMTDFVAVDMSSDQAHIVEQKLCYDRIPNYTHNIHGYDIQSICFVHEDYMNVNKSTGRINRCGEWLQLIGPSEKVVDCMVAGYAIIKTNGSTEAIERRTIGVPTNIFSRLTSGADNAANYVTQVTLFEVAFDLGVSPSLYVLNRTEDTVTIQFTDHNRPTEKMAVEYNNTIKSYYKEFDDTYIIPRIKDYINIQMVSFDDEKIRFMEVNLDKEDSATARVRFPAYKTKPCKFSADTEIFNKDVKLVEKLTFQKWQVWTLNEKLEGTMFEWGNNDISLTAEGGNLTIGFAYATALRIQKDFKELRVEMEIDGDYEFMQSHLLHDTSLLEMNFATISVVQAGLPTQYFRQSGGKTIELKVAFNIKSLIYANVITITQKLSKGTHVVLKSATLIREEEMKKSDKCNSTAFDCAFTECTISNETFEDGVSPFISGCIPTCGICRDGFVCSKKGFCVVEPVFNLREATTGVALFLVLIFISLL